MGLESGSAGILTASSFFDAETSAEKGRIGSDSAWAAGVNNINQYLQVCFFINRNTGEFEVGDTLLLYKQIR